jgi:hypothetical protein
MSDDGEHQLAQLRGEFLTELGTHIEGETASSDVVEVGNAWWRLDGVPVEQAVLSRESCSARS